MDNLMYDSLSSEYDRFVNWPSRLAIELPFLLEKLQEINAHQVLDAATGTGMHAIALAQLGFSTTGVDASPGMLERARLNAASASISIQFKRAAFGDLVGTFGSQSFDAMLCLGNSLPHVLSRSDLDLAVSDFAACLRRGGLLLIQNRNFDAVVARHERWMEPQCHSEANQEWIFQRFYDFDPDGLLTFNMITLKRSDGGNWSQQVTSSRLRPILKAELMHSLSSAGFSKLLPYGDMSGSDFNPETSPNLVLLAYLT
jgi:glycine/sarcosine N-methyltransferase